MFFVASARAGGGVVGSCLSRFHHIFFVMYLPASRTVGTNNKVRLAAVSAVLSSLPLILLYVLLYLATRGHRESLVERPSSQTFKQKQNAYI